MRLPGGQAGEMMFRRTVKPTRAIDCEAKQEMLRASARAHHHEH